MPTSPSLLSLLPLMFLATGTANRCELSTDTLTGELHIRGTVNFIEGGSENACWQIVATDGGRYELWPEQAPASVLRDPGPGGSGRPREGGPDRYLSGGHSGGRLAGGGVGQ